MTPWIFGLAVSEFIAGITCLVIGGYTLAKARSSLNVLFFGLSLPLALVGMAEGFVTLAPDAATARLWMNLAFLGWLLFLPTYIKFSTTFCAVKFKILPLFYLLAAAFFGLVVATPYFISAMTSRFYGYFYEPGSLNITYVLFYLICVCAGLYFFFFSCLRQEYYKRKQTNIILIVSNKRIKFIN